MNPHNESEHMCDASDYALGAVLGQRRDKRPHVIYYASRTLNDAQLNYSTTEKELLAVVFALDKFRSYLIGTKVIVYSDHGPACQGWLNPATRRIISDKSEVVESLHNKESQS